MNKKLQDGRFRIVSSLLAFCLLIGVVLSASLRASSLDPFGADTAQNADSGTLEKMIVGNGNVTMEVDLNRLNGAGTSAEMATLSFDAVHDTFFAILVMNGELRGPIPSSMEIMPRGSANLPASLKASYRQLVIEYLPWGGGGDYEMAVRDKKTGFTFFNIEGPEFSYDANQHVLSLQSARLLISPEFAAQLGRQADAGAVVGGISANSTMKTVETVLLNEGAASETVLPPMNRPESGSIPGPDVIVGDLSGLAQFGSSSGTKVGLAVGTDSCNFGTVNLNWLANPNNDHPVIPQNLYRMSANGDRFEQIGQSSVKHAFTALTQNLCNLGCNGTGGSQLGSGCSDPYSASLNSGPSLGSRAWINPFTGAYPRNDGATPNNDHSGHSHTGPSHRILVEISDLSTAQNPGAQYFAESQYVTPHEYAWCQTHPGQCNMYNNVSYRQYSVSGTGSPFSFSAVGSTVRMQPAVQAWTGATHVTIEPERGFDGTGRVSYKVTNPSPGVWHYEYAIYNQNLDRGIQSFKVPIGTGVTISNVGFHAPAQHPGWSNDGTVGSSGFASSPWAVNQTPGAIEWATETALLNANANAIRWGTMYNFRFDADKPPATMFAKVGFFKTGTPINVLVQGPRSSTPSPCARVISASSNPCASAN